MKHQRWFFAVMLLASLAMICLCGCATAATSVWLGDQVKTTTVKGSNYVQMAIQRVNTSGTGSNGLWRLVTANNFVDSLGLAYRINQNLTNMSLYGTTYLFGTPQTPSATDKVLFSVDPDGNVIISDVTHAQIAAAISAGAMDTNQFVGSSGGNATNLNAYGTLTIGGYAQSWYDLSTDLLVISNSFHNTWIKLDSGLTLSPATPITVNGGTNLFDWANVKTNDVATTNFVQTFFDESVYGIANGPNVRIGTNGTSVYPYIPLGAYFTNAYLSGTTTLLFTPAEPGANYKLVFHGDADSELVPASTMSYSDIPLKSAENTWAATNKMPELQVGRIIVTNGITWSNQTVRAVLPGANITGTTNSDGSLTLAASASGGSSFSTNMTTHEKRSLSYFDSEFISTSTDNNLIIGHSNGATTTENAETNRPGVISLSTATSATGYGYAINNNAAAVAIGSGELGCEWIVKPDANLTDGTETYTLRIGLSDTINTDASDGLYFRYSTDSANWIAVARGGTTESTADTGLQVVASTWYRLGIHVNADASTVTFYTNGVAACTITGANIPTSTEYTRVSASITKSNGTTGRKLWLDYVRFWKVIAR